MISVVIPVRNEERNLADQLRSLDATQAPDLPKLEVVIVDHGSTDRTVEIAKGFGARFDSLKTVDGTHCRGPSDLRNLGVASSSGSWIAFIDGDDAVAPGWLEAMVAARGRAQVLTGAQVRVPFDWQPGTAIDATGPVRPSFAGRLTLGSGNAMVARSVFDAVGGFDPDLQCREDIDLSLRLEGAGHTPVYVADAILFYRQREHARQRRRQQFAWERAAPEIYRRHRGAFELTHSNRTSVRQWVFLLATTPMWVWHRERRNRNLLLLNVLAGRLVGSVRQRVLWL